MIRGYTDEGLVNVGAYVAPTLKRRVVEVAFSENKSVSEAIREALSNWVARSSDEPAEAARLRVIAAP